MAQPFDQSCEISPLGNVDTQNGQFWVNNPWNFSKTNFNLSAYERNRVYWNNRHGAFVEISYLSGADCDGDSRGIASADLDNDGMSDLLLRQSGGGPLRVYLNRFPRRNYLKVVLRGERSNRSGLGARIVAEIGAQRIHREMQSPNTFWAQSPAEIIFGLGDASQVDRLTVVWPSGVEQTQQNIAANQRLEIREPTQASDSEGN